MASAALGAAVLLAASPAAAAPSPVASWEMNEPSGVTMTDSAGTHDGTIGADVVLSGGTYRFPWVKPGSVYRPQHIITVPNAPELNPRTNDWAVTTRFRTTKPFGNLMQKGQAGSPGGYFKMQAPKGVVSCLFRGSSGSKSVNSGVALNDGAWHTVRCARVGASITMTIDGTKVRTATGATGTIANTVPLAIGGKPNCDAVTVSCDYWVGELDFVRIDVGA